MFRTRRTARVCRRLTLSDNGKQDFRRRDNGAQFPGRGQHRGRREIHGLVYRHSVLDSVGATEPIQLSTDGSGGGAFADVMRQPGMFIAGSSPTTPVGLTQGDR
jgi:hypothetical protein